MTSNTHQVQLACWTWEQAQQTWQDLKENLPELKLRKEDIEDHWTEVEETEWGDDRYEPSEYPNVHIFIDIENPEPQIINTIKHIARTNYRVHEIRGWQGETIKEWTEAIYFVHSLPNEAQAAKAEPLLPC